MNIIDNKNVKIYRYINIFNFINQSIMCTLLRDEYTGGRI